MNNAAHLPSGKLIVIHTLGEADALLDSLNRTADQVATWVRGFNGSPLQLIKHMKFDTVGFHPISGDALNVIEQVNQTWTYAAALLATRQLLALHPEAAPYRLAPGAHASQDLDIMSCTPGLVGAETFAAVKPTNNRKLAQDRAKLLNRPELHRYVFFMSPAYPGTKRQPALEKGGPVQVWSVDMDIERKQRALRPMG
jgi:hypothetical protein